MWLDNFVIWESLKIDSIKCESVQIFDVLDLKEEDESLIYFHSLWNLLNQLIATLFLIWKILWNHEFIDLENIIFEFSQKMRNKELMKKFLDNNPDLLDNIINTIQKKAKEYLINDKQQIEQYEKLFSDLKNILNIAKTRLLEIEKFIDNWIEFEKMKCEDIKNNLKDVFETIAKHSLWRYNIVFDKQDKGENDYFINIIIKNSNWENFVNIPIIFIDMLRDITANSRKYSKIWSTINTVFLEDEDYYYLSVTDEGIGIPHDEIKSVVLYEYRASNVDKQKTSWFGMWLTKAYFFTRKLWWDMFIKSMEGVGTKVDIIIPKI